MQEITMNQLKNNMTDGAAHPVPLFASSWVALYCLLRNSLAKSRSEANAKVENDNTGVNSNKH